MEEWNAIERKQLFQLFGTRPDLSEFENLV